MRKLFVSLLMIVGISVSCYAFGSAFANLNQNKTMDGYDEFAKIAKGGYEGRGDSQKVFENGITHRLKK